TTLSALQADVSRLANRARPSVVTVIAQRTAVRPATATRASERRILTRVGSGVTLREDEIVTTRSVVNGAEQLRVRTVNGLEATATLLGEDPISNLAVLRVDDLRLAPLRVATGLTPAVGDWVMTIGTSYRGEFTQSVGNVTYLERDPRAALVQLSNAVYPGNSGGAALNSSGELVGVVQGDLGLADVTRGSDDDGGPGGASFILPIASVLPVYEELRQNHHVAYGWMGVSTRVVEVESESQAGVRIPLGALVEGVVPGGPAEKLGLVRGDLVVAFEDQRVERPEQLARWVAASRPGSTASLVWARNQVQMNGRVTLGQSPEPVPMWASGPEADLGLASNARMQQIERQIHRLNRELGILKGRSADSLR
ncbi:MAG: S1C family serine protease, partial [Candidatus Eiseniibacteriota bacterium]